MKSAELGPVGCSPEYKINGIPMWSWQHLMGYSVLESAKRSSKRIVNKIKASHTPLLAGIDALDMSFAPVASDVRYRDIFDALANNQGLFMCGDFLTDLGWDELVESTTNTVKKDPTNRFFIGGIALAGLASIPFILRRRFFPNAQNSNSTLKDPGRRAFMKDSLKVAIAGGTLLAGGGILYNLRRESNEDGVSEKLESCTFSSTAEVDPTRVDVAARNALSAHKLAGLSAHINSSSSTAYSPIEIYGSNHLHPAHKSTVEKYLADPLLARDHTLRRQAEYNKRKNPGVDPKLWESSLIHVLLNMSAATVWKPTLTNNELSLSPVVLTPKSATNPQPIHDIWYFDKDILGMEVTSETPESEVWSHLASVVKPYMK